MFGRENDLKSLNTESLKRYPVPTNTYINIYFIESITIRRMEMETCDFEDLISGWYPN